VKRRRKKKKANLKRKNSVPTGTNRQSRIKPPQDKPHPTFTGGQAGGKIVYGAAVEGEKRKKNELAAGAATILHGWTIKRGTLQKRGDKTSPAEGKRTNPIGGEKRRDKKTKSLKTLA